MNLLDNVPDKIFQPLAAPNRRFYASLLVSLYEHTFSGMADAPRKADVLAELGDFADAYAGDGGHGADSSPSGADTKRYDAYAYLVDTGWLVEIKDKYRKLVDLTPEGRILLNELVRIASGDTRSYGGAVLNVLGSLENAVAFPDERSEAVASAWQFARDFTHHLRTVSAQMRQMEERILGQAKLGSLFKAFFEDFVTRHLISDYKTLYTKNNPFRFRYTVLERIREIEADGALIGRLADAFVREGRAPDYVTADQSIRSHLSDIFQVFEGVDRQLDVIADTQARLEKRIHTIVRYMDRTDGGLEDKLTEAIKRVAATPEGPASVLDMNHGIVHFEPPVGDNLLYAERRRRREIDRSRFHHNEPDPAFKAFQNAKEKYSRLVTVTPDRMREYVEHLFDAANRRGEDAVRGSAISVDDVGEFVAFQRLRELAYMFDGYLSERYEVVHLSSYAENDWLRFQDFVVRKKKNAKERVYVRA